MFQKFSNLNDEQYEDVERARPKISLRTILSSVVIKQNLLLYIIAIGLSGVTFLNDINPFGIAYLGAIYVAGIPIFGFLILIGGVIAISLGKSALLTYFLTAIIFIGFTLGIRFKKTSRSVDTAIKIGISVLCAGIISLVGKNILLYDVLLVIMTAISTVIFYIIFSKSIDVFTSYNAKKFLSREEIVGISIMLVIALTSLGSFSIYGFSVRTVLSILVVLILGWKNGALVGTTSGISIGMILGTMGIADTSMIASYALSGLLAGIFSKFGKLGVVLGFIVGNIILTYIDNGGISTIIAFKEILIASIGLLALPKKVEVKIEDMMKNVKGLPGGADKALGKVEQTIYALNNISEVFKDMATPAQEALATTTMDLQKEDVKEFFENVDAKVCSNCKKEKNCFSKIIQEDDDVVFKIMEVLKQNDKIEKEDIESIIENPICKNIDNIILTINNEYEKYNLNNLWQRKVDENKNVALNQLKGVSKAINEIANDLKADEYNNEEQRNKIIDKFLEKNIDFKDITIIKNEDRYSVKIYSEACKYEDECKIYTIQNILSEVLGTKMISSKIECGNKLESNVCIQKFISACEYKVNLGVAKTTKNRSSISGDSNTFMELEDGKFLLALSDGMGSRTKSRV